MKKALALLLVCTMILSLAGCNTYTSGDETTQEKTTAAAGSESADKESTAEGAAERIRHKELRSGYLPTRFLWTPV